MKLTDEKGEFPIIIIAFSGAYVRPGGNLLFRGFCTFFMAIFTITISAIVSLKWCLNIK